MMTVSFGCSVYMAYSGHHSSASTLASKLQLGSLQLVCVPSKYTLHTHGYSYEVHSYDPHTVFGQGMVAFALKYALKAPKPQ